MAKTVSHGIQAATYTQGVTEAVYVYNRYLKADPTLKSMFPDGEVNLWPMVAEGPDGSDKSYPYIRYVSIPSTYFPWRIRSDFVRYWVGEKKYKSTGKILERLIELSNIDDADSDIFPMRGGQFKIQSVLYLGGMNPQGPDQDEGIIERGMSVQIIYTKV